MNSLTRNLMIQNLKAFMNSFDEARNVFWDEKSGRLRHSGEFGVYREDLVRKWLQIVISERFGISSGFVITSRGTISTQCDIIIYDRFATPKIENLDAQRFFPVETICCVGEIKSDIQSAAELNKHLIKLSQIKRLRDEIHEPDQYNRRASVHAFNPVANPFDNIASFLICRRFGFPFSVDKLDYGSIEQRMKHNFVLSLNDGLIGYRIPAQLSDVAVMGVPFVGPETFVDYYAPSDGADLPKHILIFLSLLRQAVNTTALHEVDLGVYLTDEVSGPEELLQFAPQNRRQK